MIAKSKGQSISSYYKNYGNPMWRREDKSGAFDEKNVPPLDKIPTNEFIEKFLEEDELEMPSRKNTADSGKGRRASDIQHKHSANKAPPEVPHVTTRKGSKDSSTQGTYPNITKDSGLDDTTDDLEDDLETVLDIKDKKIPYDETGVRTYEAACRRYQALPSASFRKKLASSTEINMRHYGIGPRGAQAIAIPMVLNTTVTTLSLKGNGLSADGIRYIAKMMGENSYITDLDLSDNKLKSYGAKLLAQMMVENTYLRKLDLSGNNFTDPDAIALAKPIEDHAELKILNLNKNEFGDRAGTAFARMISENGSLQEIDLSWNCIRMKGAINLAKGVKENVGLKYLNLSWNGFGEEGAKEMAQALKTTTLTHLDLTSNRIYAEGFLAMVKALRDNDDLKVLRLGQNPVPDKAGVAALEFIEQLNDFTLQKLDLGEILFGKAFKDKLAQVLEKHKCFECPFGYTDSYGKRKLKQYNVVEEALNAMKAYCVEHNMNIVELFSRFDQDGSMSVTHDEFKEGLREAKIPLTQYQVDELIKALDSDGDGEIDFSELVLGANMYDSDSKPG